MLNSMLLEDVCAQVLLASLSMHSIVQLYLCRRLFSGLLRPITNTDVIIWGSQWPLPNSLGPLFTNPLLHSLFTNNDLNLVVYSLLSIAEIFVLEYNLICCGFKNMKLTLFCIKSKL